MQLESEISNEFLPLWEEILLDFQRECTDSPEIAIEQATSKAIAILAIIVAVKFEELSKGM